MHHSVIDKTGRKTSGSDGAAAVGPGGSTDAGKNTRTTQSSDTVDLTERSQLLERLEKTAAKLPTVDQARIDAVKADIAEGNYKIDVDNIADILLRTEDEFGDPK